jgi:hypothetical protein
LEKFLHFGRSALTHQWRTIMYIIKSRHIVAACVALYVTVPAGAQQQNGNAPPPPRLERLDEGDVPGAPAAPAGKAEKPRSVVTEKRAYGGRVTEIEVQSGRSTYYLQPNAQGGSAAAGDPDNNRMRGPQWRIGEFDLRRGGETKRASEAAAGTPPPPAAPAQPRK